MPSTISSASRVPSATHASGFDIQPVSQSKRVYRPLPISRHGRGQTTVNLDFMVSSHHYARGDRIPLSRVAVYPFSRNLQVT
jgi:hypothetical protein